MKRTLTVALTALVALALTPSWSQADEKAGAGFRAGREGGPRAERKGGWENPDTNNDMLVDEAEATAAIQKVTDRMREHFEQRNNKVLDRFDKDGDGKLSETEAQAAREMMEKRKERGGELKKKMLERFDADGDGKLSEEERQAAREAMKKRRGGKGSGEGSPSLED